MIRDKSGKMYLKVLKLLHPTHYSQGTINTLLDPRTTLLIITPGKLEAQKIKVHQTIPTNKSLQFPSSETVREWPSPFFSQGSTMQLKSPATRDKRSKSTNLEVFSHITCHKL